MKEPVVVGFVAHVNKGTIHHCENGGNIGYKGTYTEQHIYIGGLTGQNGHSIHDCCNRGAISAESNIASENQKLSISIGGIAGSTIPKGHRNIIIYRCENRAPINFNGDTPRVYVAGVIGYSGRAGVRDCTNSGNITVAGAVGNSAAKYYDHVAGVVAQSGNHIQRCDNFGPDTRNMYRGNNYRQAFRSEICRKGFDIRRYYPRCHRSRDTYNIVFIIFDNMQPFAEKNSCGRLFSIDFRSDLW
jgi:hypothetical protein